MIDKRDDKTTGDEPIITCWCGAKGTVDELFDFSDAEIGCGGSGVINCYCGGDQCVCHNHGEYECPGCDECEGNDDGFDYDGEWDEDDYGNRRAVNLGGNVTEDRNDG